MLWHPIGKSWSRRRRLGSNYGSVVLGTEPIAYWPMTENSGTTAYCAVNTAQNGTYSSDVTSMGQGAGVWPGEGAPYFDGTNDYLNIFSATLDAAFDGATGSMMIWCKVSAVGVWTDAARRFAMRLYDDVENRYSLSKSTGNGQMDRYAEAGNGEITFAYGTANYMDWMHVGLTWSDSANADQAYAYYNGIESGPNAALEAWAGGGLDNTMTTIGSGNTVPEMMWSGWLAHAAVWDRVLTTAEMLSLYEGTT